VPVLLQVETAPVRVSSLTTPSATGDIVYRPFSLSGSDCAATPTIPPTNNPATAIAILEGDVAVLMGCSALRPNRCLLLLSCSGS
jgi:hypothetical protein